MIEIRLLGSFEARQTNGTSIHPPGRRSLALLACLAVAERPWRRPDLAALLWPDRDPEQARGSLRQEFLRLRKAFEIAFDTDTVDRGSLAPLDRQSFNVDVHRFQDAAADPARTLEAVALYRGSFLDNLQWPENTPVSAWIERRREHLRLAVVACLRRLLTPAEASEPIACRLIELAPECDEAHVWLINHYAKLGDISRAIECYHSYSMALRSIGREPSSDLHALLVRLLARQWLPRAISMPSEKSAVSGWIKSQRNRPDQIAIPDSPRPEIVSERPSLVVLPFIDMSPDAAGTLLSDGLTEEMTNALAHIPGFFVTARQSAMAYRSVATDVRAIAAELGVRYAIEGSVERYNGRTRVNARLIDGRTGLHLWANRQEIVAGEVLDARDEIVQAVAAQLQPSLMASEINLALRRQTGQLDAWGWMQRALGALLHLDERREALVRAVDLLTRALELDPAYAMAHALLSAVYTWRTLSHAYPEPDKERTLAGRHASTAMRLESDNPFVLVHCAETAIYTEGRIDDARSMLEMAVTRNPNDAHCLALLGNTRRFAGDDARTSLALIDQAMRLSPRDPRCYTWMHYGSWCHWKLGSLEAMEAASRRSVDLYPAYPHSWIALTCSLGLQDKTADAKEAGANLKALYPTFRADNFYSLAERFYGRRFPGAVSAEYKQLHAVLVRATEQG
jgi:TolB-like protein/DNA-binding SARP family transcriptional activator